MNQIDPNLIPVLSLIVALLAVFVGPLISWIIAKKQMETTIRTVKQQVVGPMRQTWINNLRAMIAEVTSNCLHYWQTGTYEDLENEQYKRITDIEHTISLMINPEEDDHIKLLKSIRKMASAAGASNREEDKTFFSAYEDVIKLGRKILKEEWKVVKET